MTRNFRCTPFTVPADTALNIWQIWGRLKKGFYTVPWFNIMKIKKRGVKAFFIERGRTFGARYKYYTQLKG